MITLEQFKDQFQEIKPNVYSCNGILVVSKQINVNSKYAQKISTFLIKLQENFSQIQPLLAFLQYNGQFIFLFQKADISLDELLSVQSNFGGFFSVEQTITMIESILDIAYYLEQTNLFINDLSSQSIDIQLSGSNRSFEIKVNQLWDNNLIEIDENVRKQFGKQSLEWMSPECVKMFCFKKSYEIGAKQQAYVFGLIILKILSCQNCKESTGESLTQKISDLMQKQNDIQLKPYFQLVRQLLQDDPVVRPNIQQSIYVLRLINPTSQTDVFKIPILQSCSIDANTFVVTTYQGIHIIAIENYKHFKLVKSKEKDYPLSICYFHNLNHSYLCIGIKNSLSILDYHTLEQIRQFTPSISCFNHILHIKEEIIAAATEDGTIYFYQHDKLKFSVNQNKSKLISLSYNTVSNQLWAISEDKIISVIDIDLEKQINTWNIESNAFSILYFPELQITYVLQVGGIISYDAEQNEIQKFNLKKNAKFGIKFREKFLVQYEDKSIELIYISENKLKTFRKLNYEGNLTNFCSNNINIILGYTTDGQIVLWQI